MKLRIGGGQDTSCADEGRLEADEVVGRDEVVSGGGGGGGGVGIIRVNAADLQLGVISPEPR